MTVPHTDAPHADALGVLIQADLDGELDAVQAADLALHVAGCEECQRLLEELRALKVAIRGELPRYQAPAALRDAVERQVGGKIATRAASHRIRFRWRWLMPASGGFAAGAAIAALLAVMLLPSPPPEDRRVAAEVATASERALQPGHLFDIRSTEASEVAQWFQTRMGFAPPVRVPAGFALAGGRLDYLHHRPVAVIAYALAGGAHAGGAIELYTWPEAHVPTPPELLRAAGFALSYWREGGIEYWAVGRSERDVAAFVQAWHRSA